MSDISTSAPQSTGNVAPQPISSGGEASSDGLIASLQSELADMKKNLGATTRDFGQTKQTIDNIKKAISPETGGEGVTRDDIEAFLDPYLEESLADQKRGGAGLPLTTKLAVNQAELMKEVRELRKQLTEAKGKVDHQSDPTTQYDNQAYSTFDTSIMNGLEQIYGEPKTDIEAKHRNNLFQVIANSVSETVKEIRATDPRRWETIRRNPAAIRQIANSHVASLVPPKARQILEDQSIKDTPMSRADLKQAMIEADDIKNPEQRRKVKEMIRQETLTHMYQNKR